MIYIEVDTSLFLRKSLAELSNQFEALENYLKKYNYKYTEAQKFRIYEIRNDVPVKKLKIEIKKIVSVDFWKAMKIEGDKKDEA